MISIYDSLLTLLNDKKKAANYFRYSLLQMIHRKEYADTQSPLLQFKTLCRGENALVKTNVIILIEIQMTKFFVRFKTSAVSAFSFILLFLSTTRDVGIRLFLSNTEQWHCQRDSNSSCVYLCVRLNR